VLRISGTRRVVYDYSDPITGSTRRLLPEQLWILRDRSDDGIIARSRLARAREGIGTAIAVERFAANTFRNGARLSGVLQAPDRLGDEALNNLRTSFEALHKGSANAGKIAILEEGLLQSCRRATPSVAFCCPAPDAGGGRCKTQTTFYGY
jgi:phage portal protein BeeE